MPAAVVRRQVEVVQVQREIRFATAPVDAQILDQEAGRDHAQAVVHVAGLVQLRHRRVHQRITGAPFAPGGKGGVRLGSRFPGDGVVGGLEGAAFHVRVLVQNHGVEVAPDQFRQPHGRAVAAAAPVHQVDDGAHQVAQRDGAEAQVHGQVRWPFQCGKVARHVVAGRARQEILEQFAGARHAGRNRQFGQVAGLETQLLQGRQRRRRDSARRRQAGRVRFDVERRQAARFGAHFLQPCILVWRIDGVGFLREGHHFVFFKDHLILETEPQARVLRQRGGHCGVAGDGLRFVVVVGKDGVGLQLGRQAGNGLGRIGVQHDQVAAQCAQFGRQFGHAGVDEVDAAVTPRQGGQDGAVIDKYTMHGLALAQGVVQRGMIKGAQVAPEPYQGSLDAHYFRVFRVKDQLFFAVQGVLWPLASRLWRRCGGNSV